MEFKSRISELNPNIYNYPVLAKASFNEEFWLFFDQKNALCVKYPSWPEKEGKFFRFDGMVLDSSE